MRRSPCVLMCTVLTLLLPPMAGVAGQGTGGSLRTSAALVSFSAGVRVSRARTVAGEADYLRGRIGADFDLRPPPLRVVLYASHSAFARALWRIQGTRPQGTVDDSGSIVRGLLLLGPAGDSYVRHNLAHVYTEWVMDKLSGNASDALPGGTWLYDGLAEYEAMKYAPGGIDCREMGRPPLDVTTLTTPARWMAMRASPFGSLAYCLASLSVRAVIERIGWRHLVRSLRQPMSWSRLATRLAAPRTG